MGYAGGVPAAVVAARFRMAVAAEMGGHLKRILLLLLGAAALRADTYFLTIAGLGGEPEYEQRFTGWAKELDKLLRGEPGSKVETLMGSEATKANIEAKLRDFTKT